MSSDPGRTNYAGGEPLDVDPTGQDPAVVDPEAHDPDGDAKLKLPTGHLRRDSPRGHGQEP